MESQLVFDEPKLGGRKKSRGYKSVPWLNWDEWNFVRESLFSSSSHSVALALNRISAWRSRGCLPIVIEITASFVEVQQKDPYFRGAMVGGPSLSEEMLAMLYTMAVVRLVNGIIEKTRKGEVSIAEAARAIGIPRMLIDIRHEGSHRDLPSVQLGRLASVQALEWLKSFYWEPQKNLILFQSDEAAKIRKDIKYRLQELCLCLKSKQSDLSSSLPVKGKGGLLTVPPSKGKSECNMQGLRCSEWLRGSNRFLFLIASKRQTTKFRGSKSMKRIFKDLIQFYCSFTSDVVTVLFELLMDAKDSSVFVDIGENSQTCQTADSFQASMDDWKLLLVKFSKKKPDIILNLIDAVLDDLVQTIKAGERVTLSDTVEKNSRIQHRCSLLKWLVENLKGLKQLYHGGPAEIKGSSADRLLPKTTLLALLQKCLVVSACCNDQLMAAALLLARLMGNNSLVEKLNKLSLLGQTTNATESYISLENTESFWKQQEDSLRQAAEKLESIRCCRVREKAENPTKDDVGKQDRWVLAKSWYSCPIGMLPGDHGVSVHPVLNSGSDPARLPELPEKEEQMQAVQCGGKREASCDVEVLDTVSAKKMKEADEACAIDDEDLPSSKGTQCLIDMEYMPIEGTKGQLMINGVWKKVGEEELLAIKSAVRTLF